MENNTSSDSASTSSVNPESTRRKFLAGMGGAGIAGLAIGGVGGAILGSGGDSGGTSGSGGSIKVAGAVPLTGPYAGDGKQMRQGIEMAQSEINDAGGVGGAELVVEFMDVKDFAPDLTVSTFRKIAADKEIAAVLSGYILSIGPEIDVAAEAKLPYYGTNTSSAAVAQIAKDPKKYDTCFPNLDSTDVWYGKMFPGFVEQLIEGKQYKPLNRKIAIISANNGYSASIAKITRQEMEKIGWTTSLFETAVAPVSNWGPTLAKIRQDPPDIIFNTDLAPGDLAAFAKQFVENPTPSLVYGQYGPSIPEFLELAGSAADGWIWASLVGRLPDEEGVKWANRFKKMFNQDPGVSMDSITYDLTHIWANAASMAADPFNGTEVAYWTRQTRYRGVCGVYWPRQPGNYVETYPAETKDASAGQPGMYFQVQDGKHRIIAPAPFIEREFEIPPWMA